MIRSAEEFIELRNENDFRATHDKASKKVWEEVIRKYPDMKEWVVHNKTVPISILRTLANDSNVSVRFAVAMKRKCNADIFRRLAADSDETVRARIAWNPKTPVNVLDILKNDPSPFVQKALQDR